MDRHEARLLALRHVNRYRVRGYARLVALIGGREVFEVTGPSGKTYTVAVEAFWDGRPQGDLRVMAAVDDGSGRGFMRPEAEDFIMRPDGSFVGEGG